MPWREGLNTNKAGSLIDVSIGENELSTEHRTQNPETKNNEWSSPNPPCLQLRVLHKLPLHPSPIAKNHCKMLMVQVFASHLIHQVTTNYQTIKAYPASNVTNSVRTMYHTFTYY
jgi:hypothetical protein